MVRRRLATLGMHGLPRLVLAQLAAQLRHQMRTMQLQLDVWMTESCMLALVTT